MKLRRVVASLDDRQRHYINLIQGLLDDIELEFAHRAIGFLMRGERLDAKTRRLRGVTRRGIE